MFNSFSEGATRLAFYSIGKRVVDPVHFIARQPIIIIIIASKPIATINKQKFQSEISKFLFERLPGLVLSLLN